MEKLHLYSQVLSKGESINVFVYYRKMRGNGTAGYILNGSAKVSNFHHGNFIQEASTTRPHGGIVFPGKYTITALEDNTLYRCFSALPEFDMFDFIERKIPNGESYEISHTYGLATIRGSVTLDNGKVIEEGNSIEFINPSNIRLTANEESTIVFVKKR